MYRFPRFLLRLAARMPLAALHRLGSLLGWAVYGMSPTYRRHLRDNLRQAGYDDPRTRHEAIAAAGRMLAELPAVWFRPHEEVVGLVRRAGIVAAGTLASRVLGLGREQVLAAMFNRLETDAFAIAFLLPNLLRQLLAEGAVQTGVLPVLAATRETQGDGAARELFRRLRGLSLAVLLLVSVLGVLTAPWLVDIAASGFRQHPGQFERTVADWASPMDSGRKAMRCHMRKTPSAICHRLGTAGTRLAARTRSRFSAMRSGRSRMG